MLVNALFLLLMFRCAVDILNPGEKGTAVVALYTVVALGLPAIRIATSGTTRGDMAIGLAVCWLAMVNLLWIPADATPQLYFSITVLLPIIFLLFLSRCEPMIFVSLRSRALTLGIPVLCCLLLVFIIREGGPEAFGGNAGAGEGEKSFHVVAQTIAKFSILLMNQWVGLPLIALFALIVLNVRSALLGFLIGFLIKKYSTFNLRVFLVTVAVCAVAIGLLLANTDLVDAFLERLLYRDRVFFEQDTSNLMSGRDEIWLYYGQMLERSSLLELLFGRGAIWQYGSFPYLAHNDLLNLMICYGLAGTTAVLYAWYVILSRLHPVYRAPCVALFLTLLVTNGVVFHQSNLLFVLFMAGEARRNEVPGIVRSEEIKRRGLPAPG